MRLLKCATVMIVAMIIWINTNDSAIASESENESRYEDTIADTLWQEDYIYVLKPSYSSSYESKIWLARWDPMDGQNHKGSGSTVAKVCNQAIINGVQYHTVFTPFVFSGNHYFNEDGVLCYDNDKSTPNTLLTSVCISICFSLLKYTV